MTATREATRPSGIRIWLMAARVRTLPAAIAPVLVGTALAGYLHVFHPAAVCRRAGRRDVHPDRHEPVQRLLRRPARCRHRGPPRPGSGHGRRARPAPSGPDRDLPDVRRRRARRRLPRHRRRLAAAAGRRRLDPRRRALHRRPEAVWLRGARRGVRVPVLRDRRGRRVVLRPGQAPRLGGVRAGGAGRTARRRLCSSSTTSGTSTPTVAPASARSPSGSVATRTRRLFAAMVYIAYVLAPVTWVFGPLEPVAAARRG